MNTDILETLIDKYRSEIWRFYHDLHHVNNLCNLLYTYRHYIKEYHIVEAAIWFHDAVYNPQRQDNERRSVDLACSLLKHWDSDDLAKVSNMILATKHHVCLDDKNQDLAMFLDMDLAILGSKPESYNRYTSWIRLEYDFVDDVTYRRERTKVLQSLLNRQFIYNTEIFWYKYELAATENIKAELETLK